MKVGIMTAEFNPGVQQAYLLSPTLFHVYLHEFIDRWLNMMQTYFIIGGANLLILPLPDDHIITAKFEDKVQEPIYKLSETAGNKTESPPQRSYIRHFLGLNQEE
jgi:hypothetical protein